MIKETQTLPKWFNGIKYTKGETVTNKVTGQDYDLNNIELSMYDFIMGYSYVRSISPDHISKKIEIDYKKAISWFMANNATAYMVLLD